MKKRHPGGRQAQGCPGDKTQAASKPSPWCCRRCDAFPHPAGGAEKPRRSVISKGELVEGAEQPVAVGHRRGEHIDIRGSPCAMPWRICLGGQVRLRTPRPSGCQGASRALLGQGAQGGAGVSSLDGSVGKSLGWHSRPKGPVGANLKGSLAALDPDLPRFKSGAGLEEPLPGPCKPQG